MCSTLLRRVACSNGKARHAMVGGIATWLVCGRLKTCCEHGGQSFYEALRGVMVSLSGSSSPRTECNCLKPLGCCLRDLTDSSRCELTEQITSSELADHRTGDDELGAFC